MTKQLILHMSTLNLLGKTDKLTNGIINVIVDLVYFFYLFSYLRIKNHYDFQQVYTIELL